MHCTWKQRLGVTAAFVGGFWLLGQSTAQADEHNANGTLNTVTATLAESEAGSEARGGDGGDGGDASSTSTNSAEGGDASNTGDNVSLVQVGNVCVVAVCGDAENNVGHHAEGGAADAEQETTAAGGDGGRGGDAEAESEAEARN